MELQRAKTMENLFWCQPNLKENPQSSLAVLNQVFYTLLIPYLLIENSDV